MEDQQRAIELFGQAIDIDSSFALPYVGIAEAYNNLFGFSQNVSEEYLDESKEWAERALKVDGTLGLAYAMLADHKFLVKWDFEGAEEDFLRAIELTPGNPTARSWYANFLFTMGRREEAIAEARRSRQLDPMDARLAANEAFMLAHFGEYDRAEQAIMELLDEDLNEPRLHYLLSLVYVQTGRNEEALEELDTAEELMGDRAEYFERAYFYAKMGREGEAREMLEEIIAMPEKGDRAIRVIITTAAVLGDYDLAIEWIEKAYETRYNYAIFLMGIVDLDPLQDDPRYQDIMRKIGIYK